MIEFNHLLTIDTKRKTSNKSLYACQSVGDILIYKRIKINQFLLTVDKLVSFYFFSSSKQIITQKIQVEMISTRNSILHVYHWDDSTRAQQVNRLISVIHQLKEKGETKLNKFPFFKDKHIWLLIVFFFLYFNLNDIERFDRSDNNNKKKTLLRKYTKIIYPLVYTSAVWCNRNRDQYLLTLSTRVSITWKWSVG